MGYGCESDRVDVQDAKQKLKRNKTFDVWMRWAKNEKGTKHIPHIHTVLA
jgi:hypothetical protein